MYLYWGRKPVAMFFRPGMTGEERGVMFIYVKSRISAEIALLDRSPERVIVWCLGVWVASASRKIVLVESKQHIRREAALSLLPTKLRPMTKITLRFFSIACSLFLVSCDTATPENYFDRAVLNCNLMHGFAGSGLLRQLESPSVKLSETGNGEAVPMKRKEVIDDDITSLETNFEKVKKLKETDDTRDILQASVALYEYVLPVYKNEYEQLAKLYDEGAPRQQIDSLAQAIETKYGPGFARLFDRLTAAGKPYAARHGIKVNWGVSTEPSL